MHAVLKREVNYLLESVRFSFAGAQDGAVPHRLKRRIVRQYQKEHDLRVLVETGTYLGDMTAAVAPFFDAVHTIELGEELYRRAQERFAGQQRVRVYHGNSSEVLGRILPTIPDSVLFWLDAHFSGGITACGPLQTPIERELELIFAHSPRHVILIDDARYFDGTGDYPTLERLRDSVGALAPGYSMTVEQDVIRLVPELR
jgi:hypothetical protein